MGYTTYFDGEFTLSRKLTTLEYYYLKRFSEVRHMKRDVTKLEFNWIYKELNIKSINLKNNQGDFYIIHLPPQPTLLSPPNYFNFSHKHRKTILTLMMIRNKLYKNMDKNIFFKIFSYLFRDDVNNFDLQTYLEYHDKKASQKKVIKWKQEFQDEEEESILNYNIPPDNQPGLWCHWIPKRNKDGDTIIWNEAEKFYHYYEWISYLIQNFFIPWKIELNGVVKFQGEEDDDRGYIKIINNKASIGYK